jgi:LacI family transcriptional regulator
MDIREIAKRARVSPATASRAINGVPSVDPQLARRVRKVIEELGYYPNTMARALAQGRSRTLGLIVSQITNPFFPELVQSFEDVAVENNYEILLSSTGHNPQRMELAVRRMIERRVDGVAILTFGMEDSLIAGLRARKIPLVFVDVGPPFSGVGNVRIDYQHGIRQAVQHLAALRHVRIAFVSGPSHLNSVQVRRAAFETAMREIGLAVPPEFLVLADHTMEGGMRALTQLSTLACTPTAVVCSNDVTAIGVIRQAYECGVSVPSQLSVIGLDDIHLSQFTIPPLTTVQLSRAELAQLAFKALLREMEKKPLPADKSAYTLTTNLVLRRSTALAPPSICAGE